MPQDFHVVRCFSCETFQVHQVKKANKWQCKLCGASQTLKKVFGQGIASDCRNHVQKLNMMRKTVEEAVSITLDSNVAVCSNDVLDKDLPRVRNEMVNLPSHSRWSCYLDAPDANRNSSCQVDDEAVFNADQRALFNADSKGTLTSKLYKQQESYTKRGFAPYEKHHRPRNDCGQSHRKHVVTSSLQPQATSANEESCTDIRKACQLSEDVYNVGRLDSSADTNNRQISTKNVSLGLMNKHSRSLNAAEHDIVNKENCSKDRSTWTNAKRENIFVVSDDDLDDILCNL